VFGGHEHTMRQTVIALVEGSALSEHDNPGEATLHVLSGRVTLTSEDTSWEARAGDLLVIPPTRHEVHADVDSTLLLTVVPRSRLEGS
jgi:quercetin dioxygenase-like cupin family protein